MGKKDYISPLRFDWATKFYDPLVRWTTREYPFKRALIAQANLSNKQTILDLACGTGTLSIGIKKRFPEAKIFCVDIDEEIIAKAHKKSLDRNMAINFSRSFSDKLPFANACFKTVFSTLFFHHLTFRRKQDTLSEIYRVLEPGGQFHLADYGRPTDIAQGMLGNIVKIIDGDETTKDNLAGNLLKFLQNTGFEIVEETNYFKTPLGTIRLFRTVK